MLIRFVRVIVLVVTATLLVSAQQVPSSDAMFEAARKLDVVDGDLKAAIKQYEAIIAAHGRDPAVHAQALVGMAECHQRLGSLEAVRLFEQVVREFGEQKHAVTVARQHLVALARPGAPPLPAAMTKRQLWTGADVQGDAISADGRLVSYCENGDVVVRDLAAQRERRPAMAPRPGSGDYAETCVISRPGTEVAYSWANHATLRHELRLVAAAGGGSGAPRVIIDNPDVEFVTPLDWSPDARTLAVRLTRGDRTTQIALVSVRDGAITVLRSVDWRGSAKAAFSNDGKYLAYDLPAADGAMQRDIHVITTDAHRDVRVVTNAANDALAGWSPDDGLLLFVSDRSGSTALWAQPMEAGRSAGPPTLVRPDLGMFVRSVGLTRTGDLVYAQQTAAVSVQTAHVDFSTGRMLSSPSAVAETYLRGQASPTWSPDGQFLAWSSPSALGSRQVGVTVQSLKTMMTTEYAPQLSGAVLRGWTSDGALVYHGIDLKGRPGIFGVSARDGAATAIALASEGFFTLPSWSNDARYFVYRHQTTAGGAMVLLDRTTAQSRTLLADRSFGLFAIAPDGKSVAFVEPLQAPRALNVLTIETGAIESIFAVQGGGTVSGFRWLPDSRRIVTWTSSGGDTSGSVVPIDRSVPVRLDASIPSGFTVHPDGRRIAFTAGQRRIEVWMLQNFLPSRATTSSRR